MNRKSFVFAAAAAGFAASLALASPAAATVTFDPVDGTGFVGKGDVQYTLGLNNAQLQAVAGSIEFAAVSEVTEEVTWTCTNTKNEHLQERQRTTSKTTAGLVDSIAREKKQITGFILSGYTEGATTTDSASDGPSLNSCPSGFWALTIPAGNPEVISQSSSLEVSADSGTTWTELLQQP